ncbi:transglutaminase family protein [Ornithinicoccus halotolerans]|uniref:transglutaminase family protein n=1 Tax=Ornithinicoccus halotolerans TaxID=1748220 RepID=UPI0012975C1B|nr:DUF3488 and transglutaminase-like domain-containing protein [Ornithinicoccus halotolerans]
MTAPAPAAVSRLEDGRWAESLLAGLACLAVVWPLTSLLQDNGWLWDGAAMVLVVSLVGAVLRTLGAGPTLVVLCQLLAALTGLTATYLGDTLRWAWLPTGDTVLRAGTLLQESGQVLQHYAAPAPTTPGVVFLVVTLLTLTAISVDSIAVGARAPALAGGPLAAVFLVSVSNSGQAMAPQYFLAAGLAWLALLAQQGDRAVREWASADQHALGSGPAGTAPRGHRRTARVLGVSTVLVALLGASVLPHLPPTFFSEGLARNPDARTVGGGTASVGFTTTMDPTQDLHNRSEEPVLVYRTNAVQADVLRVTASSVYEDDRWQPPEEDTLPVEAGSGLPTAELWQRRAEADELPVTPRQLVVENNRLESPHLAVPFPFTGLEIDEPWQLNPGPEAVRVEGQVDTYSATYLQLGSYQRLPDDVGGGLQEDLPDRYLHVPDDAQPALAALAEQVVPQGAGSTLEVAAAIQEHLRSAQYRYDLELAPGVADASDPITHFLDTRQGYCVQFATAMVMLARLEGIPARMAIGFLPGTLQEDGSREVLASDAHTWPELLIDGLGWTRFEPTPGSRTALAPIHTVDEQGEQAPEVPEDGALPEPTLPAEELAGGTTDEDTGILADLGPVLLRALLVAAVLALLLALVPWAARRWREAGLREAHDYPARIEGEWLWLTRSLEDMGVAPPEPRSPRAMGKHLSDRTLLDRREHEALVRAARTLEASRYGRPLPEPEQQPAQRQMHRDVRTVVAGVERDLPWNIRTQARLLPRSAWRQLRSLLGRTDRRESSTAASATAGAERRG